MAHCTIYSQHIPVMLEAPTWYRHNYASSAGGRKTTGGVQAHYVSDYELPEQIGLSTRSFQNIRKLLKNTSMAMGLKPQDTYQQEGRPFETRGYLNHVIIFSSRYTDKPHSANSAPLGSHWLSRVPCASSISRDFDTKAKMGYDFLIKILLIIK